MQGSSPLLTLNCVVCLIIGAHASNKQRTTVGLFCHGTVTNCHLAQPEVSLAVFSGVTEIVNV